MNLLQMVTGHVVALERKKIYMQKEFNAISKHYPGMQHSFQVVMHL
jgi:hypothetical protein